MTTPAKMRSPSMLLKPTEVIYIGLIQTILLTRFSVCFWDVLLVNSTLKTIIFPFELYLKFICLISDLLRLYKIFPYKAISIVIARFRQYYCALNMSSLREKIRRLNCRWSIDTRLTEKFDISS